MTLNLPNIGPYRVVMDGAIAVQESLRSPWTFIGLDQHGNTLWMSPDEKSLLRVVQEGTIALERV